MVRNFSLLLILSLAVLCLLIGSCAPQQAALPADAAAPTAFLPPDGSGRAEKPFPSANPTGPDAAELRLARMSPDEKLCQMILLCCSEQPDAEEAAARGVGGLCLFADYFAGKDPDGVLAATTALQEAAPLPLLLAVDEEGGTVCRVSRNPQLRERPFAAPRELFEAGGWAMVADDAREKAILLRSLGLNVNLAPVADVPLDKGDYIYPRCFSADADETALYVSLTVDVMQREGVGTTLKHFPGYGGSADTHKDLAYDERPYEAFEQRDLLPFRAGIDCGADAVLVSHNIVTCMDAERPASLSPEVHRLLREELGFRGVVLCDDLDMEAIGRFTGGENAAVQAVLAGNDLICCGDLEGTVAALRKAADNGTLSLERIDESVLRILRWKLALGLPLD